MIFLEKVSNDFLVEGFNDFLGKFAIYFSCVRISCFPFPPMGMGGGSPRETRWGGGAFARGKSFELSEKGGVAERRECKIPLYYLA